MHPMARSSLSRLALTGSRRAKRCMSRSACPRRIAYSSSFSPASSITSWRNNHSVSVDLLLQICLFNQTKKRRLDRFLQLLRGAESDFLRRLDLDRLARRGIAAHARGALAHDEDAKTIETDARALLQMF